MGTKFGKRGGVVFFSPDSSVARVQTNCAFEFKVYSWSGCDSHPCPTWAGGGVVAVGAALGPSGVRGGLGAGEILFRIFLL